MIAAAFQIGEGGRFGENRVGAIAVVQLSYHKCLTFQSGHETENKRKDSRDNDEVTRTWWKREYGP